MYQKYVKSNQPGTPRLLLLLLLAAFFCIEVGAQGGDGKVKITPTATENKIRRNKEFSPGKSVPRKIIPNVKNFNYYMNAGDKAFEEDELQVAIENYNRAIKLNAQSKDAYQMRGRAFGRAELYTEAVEDFTKALSLSPTDSILFLDRSRAYRGMNEFDKAISDTNKAINLSPKYIPAYFSRAKAYKGKGDEDMALKEIARIISLTADSANGLYVNFSNLARIERADIYFNRKQYDEALAESTAVISSENYGDYQAHELRAKFTRRSDSTKKLKPI